MCLKYVSRRNVNLEGIGYKFVGISRKHKHYYLPFYDIDVDTHKLAFNKEYTATEHHIPTTLMESMYVTGFHIFDTLKGAMSWPNDDVAIVKVKYREGHTVGREIDIKDDVIVARYVTFLEVVSKNSLDSQ